MTRNEDIADLMTETFTDFKSIIGSIINYSAKKDIDLISHWV